MLLVFGCVLSIWRDRSSLRAVSDRLMELALRKLMRQYLCPERLRRHGGHKFTGYHPVSTRSWPEGIYFRALISAVAIRKKGGHPDVSEGGFVPFRLRLSRLPRVRMIAGGIVSVHTDHCVDILSHDLTHSDAWPMLSTFQ